MTNLDDPRLKGALAYLKDAGLGETLGLATLALDRMLPKVQLDTDMAVALCLLAITGMEMRKQ